MNHYADNFVIKETGSIKKRVGYTLKVPLRQRFARLVCKVFGHKKEFIPFDTCSALRYCDFCSRCRVIFKVRPLQFHPPT